MRERREQPGSRSRLLARWPSQSTHRATPGHIPVFECDRGPVTLGLVGQSGLGLLERHESRWLIRGGERAALLPGGDVSTSAPTGFSSTCRRAPTPWIWSPMDREPSPRERVAIHGKVLVCFSCSRRCICMGCHQSRPLSSITLHASAVDDLSRQPAVAARPLSKLRLAARSARSAWLSLEPGGREPGGGQRRDCRDDDAAHPLAAKEREQRVRVGPEHSAYDGEDGDEDK
jgi:hypothetical protein